MNSRHEDDYHILLYDANSTLTLDQMTLLYQHGARTVTNFLKWAKVEPEKGVYNWDVYDRYVDFTHKAGLRLVVRLPFGTPNWSPIDWYLNSYAGRNVDCDDTSRIFSIWNPEAAEYTKQFIWKVCERYHKDNVVCSFCNGWSGEIWFPILMPEEFYKKKGYVRGLWHGDTYAVEDFRRRMKKKYGTLEAFNKANSINYLSWDSVLPADLSTHFKKASYSENQYWNASLPIDITYELNRMMDTVIWYNQSIERYHYDIQNTFLSATGGNETWMGLMVRNTFRPIYIEAGMFRADDSAEIVRRKLSRRRDIEFNVIWYCVYLEDILTLEEMALHYWMLKYYPWNVWVGAERSNNLVTNSYRAKAAGCKGMILSNPFEETGDEKLDIYGALDEIEKAAGIWREDTI